MDDSLLNGQYGSSILAFLLGLLFGFLFSRSSSDYDEESPEIITRPEPSASRRKCTSSQPCTCCKSTRIYTFSRDDNNLPCTNYYKTGSCSYRNCKYVHETHGLSVLFDRLRAARRTVDICSFRIGHSDLVDKLIELKQRGVIVQIVGDLNQDDRSSRKEEEENNYILLHKLHEAGIEVRTFKRKGDQRGLMHHKFMIIDNSIVIYGSANLTWNASHHNDELMIVSQQTVIVSKIRAIFKKLFIKYEPLKSSSTSIIVNINNNSSNSNYHQ